MMEVRRDLRVLPRGRHGAQSQGSGADSGPAGAGEIDPSTVSPEALAFIRFCYRRRPVGWPDLYDEMCSAAARGAFNGWGYAELAEHGVEFTLPKLPRLAALTQLVVSEERSARRHVAEGSEVARTGFDGEHGEDDHAGTTARAAHLKVVPPSGR